MNDYENVILLTDSYKVSHSRQYPHDTTKVASYFESRGGKFSEVVFFGLQYLLKKYMLKPITMEDINEAEEIFNLHFAASGGSDALFNRSGWEYIVKQHSGKLPLSIKAVPEGSRIPLKNVLMTIENTDPACYWLTNYMETLLVQTWYPSTVATVSNEFRKLIMKYLVDTGDPNGIDFKLHDFGFRGSTSVESSGIGGTSHLVNFLGTDTMSALMIARKYYNCPMAGFSIPAAEHSTITSWGREGEADAYRNMLKQYPQGLVAVVSDSFNIYEACKELWGIQLHDEVLNRNGTVVIRPDSGSPSEVVPKVISILLKAFGGTKNSKGYWVLNPHVRVIQGDGIDIDSCRSILFSMKLANQSTDNIAFGSGGGLLQKMDRDTLKFAFKCCLATVDGQDREVYKDPITDPGKASKKGNLKLIKDPQNGYRTVQKDEYPQYDDKLVEVYRNGKLCIEYTLDEIRKLAKE